MIFHLTEHCTLRCPHCMVSSGKNHKHATKETVKKFIEFATSLKTLKIGVAGGEPTEHPDFFHMFTLILQELHKKAIVILMTNGRFLVDRHFVNELAALQMKFKFEIQVSSLKGIYPFREETISAYYDQESKFQVIDLIEEITVMENLGRAKKWDYKHLRNLFQRSAPSCSNIYLIAKSKNPEVIIRSFQDVINYLDMCDFDINPYKNFCKPLVGWDGSIYVGETPYCTKLGNIFLYRDPIRFLRRTKPCGKCGVGIPDGLF